ncbi:MAG: hypothetical protein QM767_10670 [Anaeromyxobacter sp.]
MGDERRLIVEFLQHLEEIETRRSYVGEGYSSLWDFCTRALHLSEPSAGRRIGAMRILRRFPAVEPPLRDGRINLTSLTLLGPILTAENVAEVLERAAHKTRAEVDALVASIQPRRVAADGLRRLSAANGPAASSLFPQSVNPGLPGAAAWPEPALSHLGVTSPAGAAQLIASSRPLAAGRIRAPIRSPALQRTSRSRLRRSQPHAPPLPSSPAPLRLDSP